MPAHGGAPSAKGITTALLLAADLCGQIAAIFAHGAVLGIAVLWDLARPSGPVNTLKKARLYMTREQRKLHRRQLLRAVGFTALCLIMVVIVC